MSKTEKSRNDGVVMTCNYKYTDASGHVDSCRAPVKCPICGQCSRIVDDKELGHCTGHLGLLPQFLEDVPNRGTL